MLEIGVSERRRDVVVEVVIMKGAGNCRELKRMKLKGQEC